MTHNPIAPPLRRTHIGGALMAALPIAALLMAHPTPSAASAQTARAEVIVQMQDGASIAKGHALVSDAGGHVTRDLRIVNGFGAELSDAAARRLARNPAVRAVSPNGRVESSGYEGGLSAKRLKTAFNQSIGADSAWTPGLTGRGVGVAVIDTGIAGELPDFRVAADDPRSRVVASAVVNPGARSAGDSYGHGTHVAGLIAGNGGERPDKDKLRGRYAGVAPDADLISVKVSDDDGNTSVIDVIDGLQFVLDHKDRFNIRVVNLSLNSTVAESYLTDPLDAAVEEAWFRGLVVVSAAGNRGAAEQAVSYAPANDPYVITVGAVDDMNSKNVDDDRLAPWSSRGVTQDGITKPEVLAPGASIESVLAPGSQFAGECPKCVRDDEYFRVGGTSMATGVVSGAVALLLQAHPEWTPDQVKGAIMSSLRDVPGTGRELAVDAALLAEGGLLASNRGLTPSSYIDPATGTIDLSRARFSRARFSDATELLRARFSAASFSCAACLGGEATQAVEATRARFSRARFSASYSK